MAEFFILGDHKEFGDGGAFSGFRPGLLHAVLLALDPAGEDHVGLKKINAPAFTLEFL